MEKAKGGWTECGEVDEMKTAPLTTYGDVSSQHGFVVTTAEGFLFKILAKGLV